MNDQNNKAILAIAVITIISVTVVGGFIAQSVVLSDDEPEAMDAVPADSNVVIQADPVGFAEDPVTIHTIDTALESFSGEENTYEDVVEDDFEEINEEINESLDEEGYENIDLRLQDFGNIVIFGDHQDLEDDTDNIDGFDGEYVGILIELDITQENVETVLENEDVPVEETTYNGEDVFIIEENDEKIAFSTIDNGLHVLGPENVVEDSIDTYKGDKESIDEDMRPDLDSNTYLSLSVTDFDEIDDFDQDQVDDEVSDVHTIQMSYQTGGEEEIDEAQFNVKLIMNDEDSAINIEDEIRSDIEDNAMELFETNVDRDGENVEITVKADKQLIGLGVDLFINDLDELFELESQI